MGSVLMLRPIRGIAESLGTTGKFTHVGFLSCMRSQVGLKIFKSAVSLPTSFELKQKYLVNFMFKVSPLYLCSIVGMNQWFEQGDKVFFDSVTFYFLFVIQEKMFISLCISL